MSVGCRLCPRECSVVREENSGAGFCKMGTLARIARAEPHFWEEPCISGTNGSGAVFFSGCTMSCVYCQNYEISHLNKGKIVTDRQLADEFKRLEALNVHNINLVSASHFVPAVIRALDIYKPGVPVVYNCGGYEKAETIRRLCGYVDIFLPDFKYAQDELALRLSNAPNYSSTALADIEQAYRQTGGAVYDENGIMLSGVIIRHMILPNHTKNSIAVLKLIKDRFGTQIPVSLMSQYCPTERTVNIPELNRRITDREYQKVLNAMLDLGLDGYCQSRSSADKTYIPEWNYGEH